MAVDWEPHHAEMKSLYIEHDQSLEEVRKHFAEQYDFKASYVFHASCLMFSELSSRIAKFNMKLNSKDGI